MKRLPASLILIAAVLSACSSPSPRPELPVIPAPPVTSAPPVTPTPPALPLPTPPAGTPPELPPGSLPTAPQPYRNLKATSWQALPGWPGEGVAAVWEAFQRGCVTLVKRSAWHAVCTAAAALADPDDAAARAFFETNFVPYRSLDEGGVDTGMVTGYYEPLIQGDRTRSARTPYPVYGVPDDLVSVDLATVYPELKNLRLRGRLDGHTLKPYFTRQEIEAGALSARPIAWAADAVELFFMQIQGSGRIELPDGSHLRVGYANQNGHPYRSIGKLLVERGELKLEAASMQGIKAWGLANPDKLRALLDENPSYVFFRVQPDTLPGPLGALGVPLSPERSVAVDPRFVPLGAPLFLATTRPNSSAPLERLVMAQDTGGAIRGAVRVDYFWGFGPEAGALAGRMKQPGRVWVLLPKDYPLTPP